MARYSDVPLARRIVSAALVLPVLVLATLARLDVVTGPWVLPACAAGAVLVFVGAYIHDRGFRRPLERPPGAADQARAARRRAARRRT